MLKDIKLGWSAAISIVIGLLVFTVSAYSADFEYHSASIEQVDTVGDVPARVSLSQGWSQEVQEKFWFTSQGSRILPYSWFTWLEQPDNEALFRDAAHMEMLRYLPERSSKVNPSGLPIGFVPAYDGKTGDAWLGMTCAACHTNQLDYQGQKLLIDGAPTLGNFVLFYARLVEALNETQKSDAKFERFARKVLADKYSAGAAKSLRAALSNLALNAAERMVVNDLPASFPENFTSYARLDAFGNIQNAGTAFALNDVSNRNTPSGPVSYPFLWGTHQSDVVQWNASAPNTPVIGPLARNVGEVVGVFGGLEIKKPGFWAGLFGKKVAYSSYVDIGGLGRLESMVKTLQSPVWPAEILPAIDTEKAAQGESLFAETCAGCHQVIARADEGKKYKAKRVPIKKLGTDPVTATNADRNCANTLILEGTKQQVIFGDKFGSESAAISIPVNGAVGVILDHPIKSLEAGIRPMRTKFGSHAARGSDVLSQKSSTRSGAGNETQESDDDDKKATLINRVKEHLKAIKKIRSSGSETGTCGDHDSILVYKARPLNGIWATAPYLHNGSVPSLWAMLQTGAERPDSFWVGSRSFDPVNVGYVSDSGLDEFKVNDRDGNVQPGNSNQGHEYGTDWTDDEKWAVVEYMKTL